MMEKNAKIYVAGHRGMVGSAIVRELERQGYTNIITRTHRELDLCRQEEVESFFAEEKPEYVFLAAAKVGGIMANQEALADFMYSNMILEMNVIHSAWENGCKKLALGHHNDDVLETFFLSLIHEGRVHCFSPVTYLSRTDMTQIRPMIYVRERDIRGVVRNFDIPVVHNPCPANGATQREYMKNLIKQIEKETTPGLRKRLFRAIQDSAIDGWKI